MVRRFLKGLILSLPVRESVPFVGPEWSCSSFHGASIFTSFILSTAYPVSENCVLYSHYLCQEGGWVAGLDGGASLCAVLWGQGKASATPKNLMQSDLNQAVYLPVFFPKVHSSPDKQHLYMLDIKQCLAIYQDRTEPVCAWSCLTVSYANLMKGQAVSVQTISRWIISCIRTAYEIASAMSPQQVRAHSTRAQATSIAFLNDISILDIFRETTWLSTDTCTDHYAITASSRADVDVGSGVLISLLW